MQYCIWILPQGKTQETLKKVVKALAKKYHGPIFEPHLTLLYPIPEKKEIVIDKANKIAKTAHSFKLTTSTIDYGTTYFQCAFIRVKATKPLIEAAMLARKLFSINSFFVPHISLFYGNLDVKKREKMAREIKLPNLIFKADKLIVAPAGESVPDPKDWVHLAEIKLR